MSQLFCVCYFYKHPLRFYYENEIVTRELELKKRRDAKFKKSILGDDAIESLEADWFDFETHAVALAKQLYEISKSSGVCCGIMGSWGSGKSSFMKLMSEYVSNEYPKNACTAWFTAWDPGGVEDLGDAMLYRLFHEAAERNKDLSGAFKHLQEALGVRKGIREHAHRAIGLVSKVIPEPARPVTDVASSLLELDTPRKVEQSFGELMKWLEERQQTIFFFIDDLDRASGEQIRDLLSELKVYISHRRIVAVLGYDEDYVLKALKPPVLPEGIDPKRYLEKIVTVRKNLPLPTYDEQISYAENLIKTILGAKSTASKELAITAMKLSHDNPRALKTLILKFTNAASALARDSFQSEDLISFLIATAAADMGLLSYENVRNAIESGEEPDILSALKDVANKDPSKSSEVEALTEAINYVDPDFQPETLSDLRLSESLEPPLYRKATPTQTEPGFDWKTSFFSILSGAAKHGFAPPQCDVEASAKNVAPLSAKVEVSNIISKLWREGPPYPVESLTVFSLSSKTMNVDVMLTSNSPQSQRYINPVIERAFAESPSLAADKSYALWVIDDISWLHGGYVNTLMTRAREKCNGLRHSFIFLYTPASRIQSLLTFLLDAASRSEERNK
jgi:energy-coupling factor transporter ATP-binding protein EcfA2